MNETREAQAQMRYATAVTVYALLHTALTDLNDGVHFYKQFVPEETNTLQRQVAAALMLAQELKEKMARELDATENVG